jgi:hypothetical protein
VSSEYSVITRVHRCRISRNKKSIVDEVTTLRRHLEATHSVRDWFII